MHLRSSQVVGIQVVDDGTQQIVGFLEYPLIDPDTGRVLGFFTLSTFSGHRVFLQSSDIAAWGTRVHVRSEDCLSPPDELIRLRAALEDPRRVIGQLIRTKETHRTLGICGDVQFNTRHFITEWIFPRKFFIARQPLLMTDVIEVTQEAIWVKDPLRPLRTDKSKVAEDTLTTVISDVVPTVQTRK